MNKTKIIMAITIGIMSFMMIYVMLIQFSIVNEYDGEEVELMRETELKETLASYKEKYEEINNQIIDINTRIEEYQKDEKSEEDAIALLEEEVEQKNMLLGITDVQGEGIVITMNNPSDYTEEDSRPISASDLVMLINELRMAGAEAISINGQRIIAKSDVVEIRESIFHINGQRVTAPFTIKAIGDIKYLTSALSIKGGYIDTYTKNGIKIHLEGQSNVAIEKSTQNMNINYAKGEEVKK